MFCTRTWRWPALLGLAVAVWVSSSVAQAEEAKKKVLFIAGPQSHGYGSHEHKAGCMLLAEALNRNVPEIEATVHPGGWPQDKSVFDGVDAVVIYSDGGGGHPVNPHLDQLDELAGRGVGIACIHYAVEVPKEQSGSYFLDWIGGYFEMNWSVNPHWTGKFEKLPKHPITRGVEPFEINDEWYYHMRFRPGLDRVKPILSALPPKDTLSRPDGPHSGNPDVRAAVEKGEEQHVAWATERPDGGRGFGFTGGHNHWNWGHDEFRQLVLNAIAWTAKVEVPKDGVKSDPLSVADLKANQDESVPEGFDDAQIERQLAEWNGK